MLYSNLKTLGNWYVEGYSVGTDLENVFKNMMIKKEGKTHDTSLSLSDQFSDSKMFCFQCEQTNNGKGCSTVGVCGKTPEVAYLQDLLIQYVKQLGFLAHELKTKASITENKVNRLILAALFSTLTNVNFDEKRMVDYINEVKSEVKRLELLFVEKGITLSNFYPQEDTVLSKYKSFNSNDGEQMKLLTKKGEEYGVLKRALAINDDSITGLQEMLVYGMKGIAAYADHALLQNKENDKIYEFLNEAFHFLATPGSENLENLLGMLMKCGQANYLTMQLLHEANTIYGAQTPHSVKTIPEEGKCILVSGHDLKMLEEILKQSADKNINVYTHGELLPAHGYEGLRKYKNLKGHFGTAWQRQSIEFADFPGAIVMTTNCLTPPKDVYSKRLFTAGAVGFSGISHVSEKGKFFNNIKIYFRHGF